MTLAGSSSTTVVSAIVVSAIVESAAAESARGGESSGTVNERCVSPDDGEASPAARLSGVANTESDAQLRVSEFWRSVSSTLLCEVRLL